jgi:dehydrogenase/reductase SDR family protein 4
MIKRGGGVVLNIASIAGIRPQREGLVYSFTKAGLIMMTRVWAMEFGKHNVRVNAIAPGLIQTDFSEYFWKNEEYVKRLEAKQPIPRIGQAEEVGSLALFLVSGEASFITGQTYVVDGGATAV